MKTYAIRHVGIAAQDAQQMADFFIKMFGGEVTEVLQNEADQEASTFVKLGDELLEIMQPYTPDEGTIGKFISKKGQGLHHISLAVEGIDELIAHLQANNVPMLPANLVGRHKAFFVHPKACGILIEVVEYDYLK